MFVITYSKIFLAIAAAVMVSSIAIIGTLGLNLGIDFTGGALTEVAYDERPDKASVDAVLGELDLGGYSLRESQDEAGREAYILRTRDLSEAERIAVSSAVTTTGGQAEVTRFTSIGPVIGEELKDKAVWAIGAVVLVIILYVAFAFAGVRKPVGSWVYGGITILALIHDVLVPTAVMSLLGYLAGVEVDVLFVMALLAVLGYSVNDTIVVFDRVRENLIANREEKKTNITQPGGIEREEVTYTLTKPFSEIVGMSVSQTLMRSINTSVTTLLALGTLYFLGGDVTQTFALILIAGVVAGTYSSIFLANPLLVWVASRQASDTK
ncbi:protein translocase subunit SecF [Candidatus Pacebacteria bacterium]|nr:protein translocase subunit SecF [Candidatus Paceibacterota bacterium]